MPLMFKDVCERVTQRIFAVYDGTQPIDEIEARRWEEIIRVTVEEVGFHISDRGEVCDPRPPISPASRGAARTPYMRGPRRRR